MSPGAPTTGAFRNGPIEGFEEERWLDIRKLRLLKPIMRARLQTCVDKGFDAADFDNVDAYQNDTGLRLRGRDQLRYNAWLANEAHRLGLAAGLKNDLGQVPQLVDYFDFQVNEQCYEYDECDRLAPFIAAGKPVFGIEYKTPLTEFCADSITRGFSTIRKTLALRAPRETCPPPAG
jgi:hypothetical protein